MAIHSTIHVGFPFEKQAKQKRYRVDITQDPRYLDQAFSLRYQIFNVELGEGLRSSEASQRDRDRYDDHCDHLVVIDQDRNLVVANYRILPEDRAKANGGFYSETEFDLANIYANLPRSAEIGRCCVHPEYRDGIAMNLLWEGVAMYMEAHNIVHLFGCASLPKADSSFSASQIYSVFKAFNAVAPASLCVAPRAGLTVPGFQRDLRLPENLPNPRRLLPSLLRGYLMLGVQICGDPAYDAEFDVIDFFALFNYAALTKALKRFIPG